MAEYRFTRDTTLREGRKVFAKGEVVTLSPASARHWLLRGAVVELAPIPPQQEAQVERTEQEAEDAQVERTEQEAEDAQAQNSGHLGDGGEPDAAASGDGASSAPTRKTGGRSRK